MSSANRLTSKPGEEVRIIHHDGEASPDQTATDVCNAHLEYLEIQNGAGGGDGIEGFFRGNSDFQRLMDQAIWRSFGDYTTLRIDNGLAKGTPVAEQKERELRPSVERFLLKSTSSVAWDDVVGNAVAKRELIAAIEHPIVHRELYAHYRKAPTKGVLLYGPQGCGKTMFGKAAAAALRRLHGDTAAPRHAEMMHIKAPELQSMWVGETEKTIRQIFAYARAWRDLHGFPLVMFIDEADAILPPRDRHAAIWTQSNVATFLAEMDGLEESAALVILATNRPSAIDAAITRDGRVDRMIRIDRPDEGAIAQILANALRAVPAVVPHYDLVWRAAARIGDESRRLLRVRSSQGIGYLRLYDVVTGAMLVNIVERAKQHAFEGDLAAGGAPTGIGMAEIDAAVDDAFREALGKNHSYAIEEYAARIGVDQLVAEAL